MNSEIESTEDDLLPSLPFCVLDLDFVDDAESLAVDMMSSVSDSPQRDASLRSGK